MQSWGGKLGARNPRELPGPRARPGPRTASPDQPPPPPPGTPAPRRPDPAPRNSSGAESCPAPPGRTQPGRSPPARGPGSDFAPGPVGARRGRDNAFRHPWRLGRLVQSCLLPWVCALPFYQKVQGPHSLPRIFLSLNILLIYVHLSRGELPSTSQNI